MSETGPAMLLLSGGIDSPVAGHVLKAQRLPIEAIHFSLEPFTDSSPAEKSLALAGMLGLGELTIVPAGPLFAEIPKRAAHRLYFVLSKRFMVRVADAVARERGAPFLATGESLGQVSSQTLPHLAAIDGAATRPILRPLLGWDKEEIIRVAQRIGTFETSKGPEVCDVLGPKHPATHAPIEDVLREESKLDVPSMVEKAIATLGRRAVPPPGAARTAVPSATMKR